MAATSYSPLPSNAYVGLGSQGDLLHSANYGTYDSGVGSLIPTTTHYPSTGYGSYLTGVQRRPLYSDDYVNGDHTIEQPDYYGTDKHDPDSAYNQETLFDDYPNPNTQKYHDEPRSNNNIDDPEAMHLPPMETIYVEPTEFHQLIHNGKSQNQLPPSTDSKPRLSEGNPARSDRQHFNNPSSSGENGSPPHTTNKTQHPTPELKTNKSTKIRAAAIKQREENREAKQKDNNSSPAKKKLTPPKPTKLPRRPPTDTAPNPKEKPKRDKKESNSVPHQRMNHRDEQQFEGYESSGEEMKNGQRSQNKPKKNTALSDPRQDKNPPLPPVRRGRGPPLYDPVHDHPFAMGYPLRARYPYYDGYLPYGSHPYPGRYDYRFRHLEEDGYDTPPYLPSSHTPYDGFFDYEKRKPKARSKSFKDRADHPDQDSPQSEPEEEAKGPNAKKSKTKKGVPKDNEDGDDDKGKYPPHHPKHIEPPYDDGRDMLEMWRQERNDYLKKKYKPTVHDVLYSQQWMKTDSYLENQRRRALRDIQGYYFPYKKYTLKDYKDLQRQDAQNNPYASINDASNDRKERARKRQEYASQIIEKHNVESSSGQKRSPREIPSKKPPSVSNIDPNIQEKLSKRERALEYAKIQVRKQRSQKPHNGRSSDSDPTEQYVNSLFPNGADDDDDAGSDDERHRRNRRSVDDENDY